MTQLNAGVRINARSISPQIIIITYSKINFIFKGKINTALKKKLKKTVLNNSDPK